MIVLFDGFHKVGVTTNSVYLIDTIGKYTSKTIFRAITLTTLSEGAMSVSHELMGTSAGDSIDLESEIDMLKNGMMTVLVKMFNQSYRVLGVAIVANARNLSDCLNRIRRGLNECYVHVHFSPLIFL
jgi:hypothetical protein